MSEEVVPTPVVDTPAAKPEFTKTEQTALDQGWVASP